MRISWVVVTAVVRRGCRHLTERPEPPAQGVGKSRRSGAGVPGGPCDREPDDLPRRDLDRRDVHEQLHEFAMFGMTAVEALRWSQSQSAMSGLLAMCSWEAHRATSDSSGGPDVPAHPARLSPRSRHSVASVPEHRAPTTEAGSLHPGHRRLLHHAHICVTEGESFRLAQAAASKGMTALPTCDPWGDLESGSLHLIGEILIAVDSPAGMV